MDFCNVLIPFPNLMNHQFVRPFLASLLPGPDWWSLLGLSSHCDGDLVCETENSKDPTKQKNCMEKKKSDVQDQFVWTLWNLSFAAVVKKVEKSRKGIPRGCRVLDKSDKRRYYLYLSICLAVCKHQQFQSSLRTSDIMICYFLQHIMEKARSTGCQLSTSYHLFSQQFSEKTIVLLLYATLLEYLEHTNMTLRTANVFHFFRISQSPGKGTVHFTQSLLQTLNSQALSKSVTTHQALDA